MWIQKFLSYCFICGLFSLTVAQNDYSAVVVDYSPVSNPRQNPETVILTNADEYMKIINTHNRKDIIVFPEYGLTTLAALDSYNVSLFATLVPEAHNEIDRCTDTNLTDKVIRDFACYAKQANIYIVINLLEKDRINASKIFNTNVVFSRNGTILAKYRKINLFGSETTLLAAGEDIVTFKTDFGVHFGIFTCYDILFIKPAFDIIDKGVTDIIFPTAWFSQVPFLSALTVQDGYAKAVGVNLLASGYSNPQEGSGGSGIYTAKSMKFDVILPVVSGIRPKSILVEKNPKADSSLVCTGHNTPDTDQYGLGGLPGVERFKLKDDLKENREEYTFEAIPQAGTKHNKNICSPKFSKFCCDFEIELIKEFDARDPVYMYLVHAYSNTVGSCGIIACNESSVHSCLSPIEALRSTSSVVFRQMNVSSTNIDAKYAIPTTLTYKLLPFHSYNYCKRDKSVAIHLGKSGDNLASGIVVFGFYTSDRTTAESSNFALSYSSSVTIIVFLIMLINLYNY